MVNAAAIWDSDEKRMPAILVTGGAGFIGANFVRIWRKRHPSDAVTVLDVLTYAGNLANLEGIPDIDFVNGDIRDFALVKRLLVDRHIGTLVHLAAESHVDRSIDGPDAFIDTNIVGTHSLLKAAKAVWLDAGSGKPHRFHHVSTDEVFGALGSQHPACTEHSPYAPNSPYSASKAASDHLVRAYHRTFGLQVTTSNCSNNYGPYQFPEKLIPLAVVHALTGQPLPIYGTGGNVRDWLYVEDHCLGLELILVTGKVGETYNIGGGVEWTNLEVVGKVCKLVDAAFAADRQLAKRYPDALAARGTPSASLQTFVDDRNGHDWRYAIDAAKIRRELGYAPRNNFAEALRTTVNWYIANEPWWRAVLDGSCQR
jgi:dTDP-glucose 4,6-dehydratase